MNSRLVSILLGVVVAAAVISLVAYRASHPHGKTEAAHAVLMRDRSDSTTSGCAAIGGFAQEFLHDGKMDRFSSIIALATGDERSSDEPIEFARLNDIKRHSVKDDQEAIDQEESALVEDLIRRCDEQGGADRSPLYLAIRRGIEELRALGCHDGTGCVLYVQSDLAENGDSGLRKALLGDPHASLPAPIDNRGIVVHICGIAETSGPADGRGRLVTEHRLRGAKRADLTVAIWLREFTTPSLVFFEPHCLKAGKAGCLEAASNEVGARGR
jgi:hypothetical protein